MSITLHATRKDLLAAVEPCAKAAAKNSPIMLLQCLKFETTKSGIKVTGTDANIEVTRMCPSLVMDDAAFCVRADLIAPSIKSMPDGDVSIEIEERSVRVTGGSMKFRHPILDSEDFPSMAPTGEASTLRLTGSAIRGIASCAVASLTAEKSRPALECINLSLDGKNWTAAATDTHRLMMFQFEAEFEGAPMAMNLHREFIASLGSFGITDAQEVTIEFFANLTRVETFEGSVSRVIGWGEFPNWRRFASLESTRSWTFDNAELTVAVTSLGRIASENANRIVMVAEDNTVKITCRGESSGNGECLVNVTADNADLFRTAFNYRFLLDCCAIAEGQELRIGMTEATRPVILTSSASPNWTGVIMPMALT